MTYLRGDIPEFDAWEKHLGNKGWNWNTMLKYYKKLERFVAPEKWQTAAGATFDPDFHGTDGEVHTCFNPKLLTGAYYEDTVQAWESLGLSKIKDDNSGSVAGFDVWPQLIDAETNTRWDAATAFYWPVSEERQNLKLVNGTVSKLLWDDASATQGKARAAGVEYTNARGAVVKLQAKKEVILAAGALTTPLILENSGVGQAALLKSRNIPVIVDLPGVGENLVDNPLVSYVYKTNLTTNGYTPYSTFATAQDLFGDETAAKASSSKSQIPRWAQQVVDRSSGALNASAIEKLMTVQHSLIFNENVTIAEIVQSARDGIFAGASWDLLPFSRGSIHTTAGNGISKPAFDLQFLAVDFDIEKQVAAGKLARSFYGAKQIAQHVTGYIDPSTDKLPEQPSDEEWVKFIRGAVNPNNHPLGTASMMARELGGVVSPKLKVYGTANVRVVDASVVPTQISGHLTATIYAIAERASEFIRKKC